MENRGTVLKLVEELRDYMASLGFYRLDKMLLEKGICKKSDFQIRCKKTEVYVRQSPNILILVRIYNKGWIHPSYRIVVYAGDSYERAENGRKLFPEQDIRMESLGVLDDMEVVEPAFIALKEKIKKRVDSAKQDIFNFDLHTHCSYGEPLSVGFVSCERLVEYAWFRTGLDGIALVPHYTYKGDKSYWGVLKAEKKLLEIEKKLGIKKRVFIILKGLEYSVNKEQHLLAIYPENVEMSRLKPDTSWSVSEAVGFIHDQGGIAIAPHPLMKLRGIGKEALLKNIMEDENAWKKFGAKWVCTKLDGKLDGMEVLNGCLVDAPAVFKKVWPALSTYNEGLEELGKSLKKEKEDFALTAGSDTHKAAHVGICTTKIHAEKFDYESIFNAIKKGETTPQGNCLSWKTYPLVLASGWFLAQVRKVVGNP